MEVFLGGFDGNLETCEDPVGILSDPSRFF